MTSTAAASPLARDRLIVIVPVLLLLFGAGVRYLAYLSITPAGSPPGFVNAMCVWDCYWYDDIVVHGYQAYPEVLNFGGPGGISNWAFFPLYPLLIAGLGKLVPLEPATLGALVSPLLTLGAVLFSRPLFAGGRRAYFLFSALLLAGPFSFYFSISYSESLFLFLTVLAFRALQSGNFPAAGLVGALLSATRTVGVLFVFAIFVEIILAFRREGLGIRQMPAKLLRRPDMVFAILATPLGIFAFMAWLYLVTGDAFGFVHIQRAWDRQLVNPLTALWDALTSPDAHHHVSIMLGFASLAGLVLCGVLFWQRQYSAAVFSTLCLVLALTNGVESMLRFVVALAPVGIALCQLLARRGWLFWASLAVFVVLDFEFTIAWLQQQGALM